MTISDRLANQYTRLPKAGSDDECKPWDARAEFNRLETDLKLIDAQLRVLTSAWETFTKAYPKHIADTERKISDLADRLSVVHVQAQGDAKVRAKQGTAYGTAQPIMHWPDLEGVDANRMRTSVIDDCLKQGEKRIRLDELGIIAKRLDGKTMPWIAQRLGYQPIPVGETLMNEIEKRRREIEEGT